MRSFLFALFVRFVHYPAWWLTEKTLPWAAHHEGRLSEALFDLNERLDPWQRHRSGIVLGGAMCGECLDLAPGWWDVTVDCSGHRCGRCRTCLDDWTTPDSDLWMAALSRTA